MVAYAQYHAYSKLMNEAMYDTFVKRLKQGYSSAKGETEEQYEKYSKAAGEMISQVAGAAAEYSKKLGIPPELAVALLAAGAFGGSTARSEEHTSELQSH